MIYENCLPAFRQYHNITENHPKSAALLEKNFSCPRKYLDNTLRTVLSRGELEYHSVAFGHCRARIGVRRNGDRNAHRRRLIPYGRASLIFSDIIHIISFVATSDATLYKNALTLRADT